MKPLKMTALLIVLLMLGSLTATAGDVKDDPGYVDLSWIEIPDEAEEVQDMDLGQVLKTVAADARENGDTELAKALTMVRSIRLKAFSVSPETEDDVSKAAARIKKTMDKDDWGRIMHMKNKGEEVSVYTKETKDEKLVGLMVVAIDMDDMATFANVAGDLDLVTLMHLIGAMDGDDLEGYFEDRDIDAKIHVE